MSAQDQTTIFYGNRDLGSLTTTGANESRKAKVPNAISVPLLQTNFLSALWPVNEVWRPVGISWVVTTGVTVTAAVVTLRKNGVSAATGGTATIPIQAADATQDFFAPFSAYTFAAADAAGDQWSVLVSTTSTAGVINPVVLWYACKRALGINEGVTL
jgi:hypothetical protein